MDSLVETGDLRREGVLGCKVTPKALVTLAQYEEENRRHRDNIRVQQVIALVTICLFIAAIGQLLPDASRVHIIEWLTGSVMRIR